MTTLALPKGRGGGWSCVCLRAARGQNLSPWCRLSSDTGDVIGKGEEGAMLGQLTGRSRILLRQNSQKVEQVGEGSQRSPCWICQAGDAQEGRWWWRSRTSQYIGHLPLAIMEGWSPMGLYE